MADTPQPALGLPVQPRSGADSYDDATLPNPAVSWGGKPFAGLGLFGDSITAQNNYATSAYVVTKSQNIGFAVYANALAGDVCDIRINAGIAGNTTTQMLARVDPDIIANKAYISACTVLGGTNDPNTDPAITIPNLKAIYKKLVDANIYVFALTILPRPAAGALQQANINRVNEWIKNYWRSSIFGECVDAFSAVVDPTSTSQAAITNALPDNTHPSNLGAVLVGKALAPRLAKYFVNTRPLLSSASDTFAINSGSANLLPGGLMLTSGGQVYNTFVGQACAAGFILSGTLGSGSASLAARADGFGNDQVITATAGAVDQQWIFDSPVVTLASGAYAVGDVLRWQAAISLDAGFAGIGEIFGVAGIGSSTQAAPNWLERGSTPYVFPSGAISMVMSTAPFTADAQTNQMTMSIRGRFAAASGPATVRIGRMSLVNLTKLGIAP